MPSGPRRPRRPLPRLRRRPAARAPRPHRRLPAAAAAISLLAAAIFLLSPRAARKEETTAPATRPAAATARPATKPSTPAPARRSPRPGAAEAKPSVPRLPGDAARNPGPPPAAPRAALIIDDLGQSFAHFEAVAALELPLSVAILPGLPATRRTAREARRRGIETLLHLPMEPRDSEVGPGEGALLTSLPPAEIAARIREARAAVPNAVGVNNHMGSRFTADPAAMAVLMAGLRSEGLFWVDSRTTAATVGIAAAATARIPAAARDVFIDAERDPAFIRSQLRKLLGLARRRGTAIGIGHPYPETLAALAELHQELAGSGVTWVPVAELVGDRDPASSAFARVPPAASR